MSYAHKNGVIHRDIKPANILIGKNDLVRITDFGIASAEVLPSMTGKLESLGTPHYMSPEQISAQDVDHRSDIYSLGCLIYEMLTGQPPFTGTNTFEVLQKQTNEKPNVTTSAVFAMIGLGLSLITFPQIIQKVKEMRILNES